MIGTLVPMVKQSHSQRMVPGVLAGCQDVQFTDDHGFGWWGNIPQLEALQGSRWGIVCGPVESGVREDLRRLGTVEPRTTLETLAVRLASLIDGGEVDDIHAASIARELRLTMQAVANQPSPTVDAVGILADQVNDK